MNASTPVQPGWTLGPLTAPRAGLVALVAVAGVVGLAVALGGISTLLNRATAAAMPTNPAIEARWGIRVTHVAVTADGGLVEVRFLVVDGDKALAMMGTEANVPVLHVEGSDAVVGSAALMSSHKSISPGRSSFLLYRNTRGAIEPGTSVTIVFGDLRLEHVVAQ